MIYPRFTAGTLHCSDWRNTSFHAGLCSYFPAGWLNKHPFYEQSISLSDILQSSFFRASYQIIKLPVKWNSIIIISYQNRVKNTLDQKSRILLTDALIFSHLNYCSSIKSICSEKLHHEVQKCVTLLQKWQARGNI